MCLPLNFLLTLRSLSLLHIEFGLEGVREEFEEVIGKIFDVLVLSPESFEGLKFRRISKCKKKLRRTVVSFGKVEVPYGSGPIFRNVS